jgi:rubrerythrin
MYDEFSNVLGYMNYPYIPYNKVMNSNDVYRVEAAVHVSKEILELIRSSVASEREDELFYDFLISKAPNEEDIRIIESIRNDERHHNQMFRKIYLELTGVALPKAPEAKEPELDFTYMQGLEKALMGELSAVEKYRKILAEMSDKQRHNMVFEILTDELKHAAKYNFLIAKNMALMSKM